MTVRLSATPAAREAIRRLRAARGHGLMFVQSGGCCAGSAAMCFPEGEFITGPGDLQLGELEDSPLWIDSRLYAAVYADAIEMTLDVAPGEPEGFSLGPGDGTHFVLLSDVDVCALPDRSHE